MKNCDCFVSYKKKLYQLKIDKSKYGTCCDICQIGKKCDACFICEAASFCDETSGGFYMGEVSAIDKTNIFNGY